MWRAIRLHSDLHAALPLGQSHILCSSLQGETQLAETLWICTKFKRGPFIVARFAARLCRKDITGNKSHSFQSGSDRGN